MALYRGFGNEALPLAESWADGKPGEVQTKWKSFGDGNATGTVNVNTLFYIVKAVRLAERKHKDEQQTSNKKRYPK